MKRALLFVALAAAACARSVEPSYHALYPTAGTPVSQRELMVAVVRPTLPRHLDRPQLVRHAARGRLQLSSNEHWGSPLEDMVGDTLAEDLARRLPGGVVFTEQGAITATPDVQVEVSIREFGLASDGQVKLSAQVALHFQRDPDRSRLASYALSAARGGDGAEAVVEQMSRLLGQLSTHVARDIAAAEMPAEPTAGGAPLH